MSPSEDIHPEDVLTQEEINEILARLERLDQQLLAANAAKHMVCVDLRKRLETSGLTRAHARSVAAQVKARRDAARREHVNAALQSIPRRPFSAPVSADAHHARDVIHAWRAVRAREAARVRGEFRVVGDRA